MVIGSLTLTSEDVDRLAAVIAPLVASRLDRDEKKWFTVEQYVAAGYAPSADAVRQRVRRKTIKFKKEGGRRLLICGPSDEA